MGPCGRARAVQRLQRFVFFAQRLHLLHAKDSFGIPLVRPVQQKYQRLRKIDIPPLMKRNCDAFGPIYTQIHATDILAAYNFSQQKCLFHLTRLDTLFLNLKCILWPINKLTINSKLHFYWSNIDSFLSVWDIIMGCAKLKWKLLIVDARLSPRQQITNFI